MKKLYTVKLSVENVVAANNATEAKKIIAEMVSHLDMFLEADISAKKTPLNTNGKKFKLPKGWDLACFPLDDSPNDWGDDVMRISDHWDKIYG